MRLVIDMPDGCYKELSNGQFPVQEAYRLVAWIKDGTPLPTGHGRLIDADKLVKQYNIDEATKYGNKNAKQQAHSYSTMMLYEIADMIDDAPTIIEAEAESEV